MITTSAPAKTILFGEHVVVHGRTAVACALSLRTYVQLTLLDEPVIEMEVPSVERLVIRVPVGSVPELTPLPALDAPSLPLPFLASIEAAVAPLGTGLFTQAVVAFVALWRALGGSAGVRCVVRTEVPMAVGMGSSAAFNVAVSAALLRLLGHPITLDAQGVPDHASATRINGWAWAAERIMHGTPSGIDNATSSFGGVLAFTKGHLEALHNIPPLRFLLVNTRVYRNTKALVGKVGALVAAYPAVCVPLLDAVQAISQQALTLFRTQPPLPLPQVATPVAQLMAINDGILAALGVGHPRLDEVRAVASSFQCASKLTGAGGGGCALVLLRPDIVEEEVKALEEALRHAEFECYEARTGVDGVKVEQGLPQSTWRTF